MLVLSYTKAPCFVTGIRTRISDELDVSLVVVFDNICSHHLFKLFLWYNYILDEEFCGLGGAFPKLCTPGHLVLGKKS